MQALTYANTKPFVPPIDTGKVIKVYDGDTITVATMLYEVAYRFSVRLNGIDTPEIKGGSAQEKERAVLARDELSSRLMNKIVTLKNVSTEKYGRVLADVYLEDECINQWMIQQGHAKEYHGGHKEAFKEN
jgi:endonuclease YncB( thermonuclease family)